MKWIARLSVFVVLVAVVLSGCATLKHETWPTTKHGLGARAKAQDMCKLTVINATHYAFKYRVGHMWWEEQDGLSPHSAGEMLIEQDEEHVLVRVYWVSGREFRDTYRFYIPKGKTEHTITFGGIQTGVIVNQSGLDVRVLPPGAARHSFLPHNGLKQGVRAVSGNQPFIVFFGPKFDRAVRINFKIDDVRRDKYFDGMWVDWIAVIKPEHTHKAIYILR